MRYVSIVLVLLLAACSQKPVACTMDAKICPDGSAVGRVPPVCEFAPCPVCECPDGYVLDGSACNPECYYSEPPCLAPSVQCIPK